MKNLFILVAVGTVTALSAVQYNPQSYNQGSNQNQGYYNQGSNQNQGYNQGSYSDRYNQRNQNQGYCNNPYNQGYNQGSYRDRYNQGYNQNQGYNDQYNEGGYSQNQRNYNNQPNRSSNPDQGYYNNQSNQANDQNRQYSYEQQMKDNSNFVDNSKNYLETQLQDSEKKFPLDNASSAQDRQLNARIREKLNGGWFSKGYTTLVLKTANGDVVVSGTVDKVEDIKKIADQIKDVNGVRSVSAQLTVKK